MATYKAVAAGDWSNLVIWQDNSSGVFLASTVLPSVADVVYFNSFTIQANINILVDKLLTESASGIVLGGSLVVTTSRTIIANSSISTTTNTTDFIIISGTTITVTITSLNIYSRYLSIIKFSATNSILNINGNIYNSPVSNTGYGLQVTGINNIINIVGDQIAPHSTNSNAVNINSAGNTITIVGNQIASGGAALVLNTTSNLNIIGNQIASATYKAILFSAGTHIVNILGNQTGSNANSAGIAISSSAGVTTTLNIQGNCYAGTTAAAIGQANIFYKGGIYNNSSKQAIVSDYLTISNTIDTFMSIKESVGLTMVILANTTSIPNPINVRQGINYTAGNIGTLIVPSPSNVRKGVPTDATVGTADLSAADMWNYLTSAITTPGSIGETVKNIKLKTDNIPTYPASVESVGAIVASYNV